jgi:MFS family permease
MRTVIYVCALVLGSVLMGFEILASRYLTPYFGSGVHTWAALIAVVLLAMTLGYFIGGRLIDRFPTLRLAALFSGFAGAWFLVVPVIASRFLEAIMLGFEDEVVGVLLASCVLLLAPIAALGTYSPIAVRLMMMDIARSGSTAGTIYGVSTFGNILGTLGTALWVIPNVGTRAATLGFGVVALACAVVLWLAAGGFRRGGSHRWAG